MMTPPVLTCVCWLVLLVPGVRNSGEFHYKHSFYFVIPENCEAQGKGRAKGRPRKVTKRSFMDGGWWLVVYLSLMLYIKFG